MILALDTSTAACTAALFDESGTCIARADELIGRGHSERLVPMIADMLEGRTANRILVGTGPGSFTGIRVGIAAAHGLAIGWGAELLGMSSLYLHAAGIEGSGEVAVAISGGHGEIIVQQIGGPGSESVGEFRSLPPGEAAAATSVHLVVGSAAAQLVEARGWGEARECWPSAASALSLPAAQRTLQPKPIYARPPDAKVKAAA
jgi:tRNA threonylcarbamoyl adenosine modification protein YeaZ